MKAKEVRELSISEIGKRSRETRKNLLNLNLRKTSGLVEKSHQIKEFRREVARLETIHREKLKANIQA